MDIRRGEVERTCYCHELSSSVLHHHPRSYLHDASMTVTLRYIGHILIVLGYFIVLNVSVFFGVLVGMSGHSLVLPWAIQNKMWDLIILLAFFVTIQLAKLIELL